MAIAVSGDAEAERIGRQMLLRGYRPDMQLQHEAVDRLATLRLVPPAAGDADPFLVVDLLFASSGIENEIVAEAEPLEVLPGLVIPTARVEHLLAMKVLSYNDRRPQDQMDIQALLQHATHEQFAATRRLLKLVAERGYHRDRNLQDRLDSWFK